MSPSSPAAAFNTELLVDIAAHLAVANDNSSLPPTSLTRSLSSCHSTYLLSHHLRLFQPLLTFGIALYNLTHPSSSSVATDCHTESLDQLNASNEINDQALINHLKTPDGQSALKRWQENLSASLASPVVTVSLPIIPLCQPSLPVLHQTSSSNDDSDASLDPTNTEVHYDDNKPIHQDQRDHTKPEDYHDLTIPPVVQHGNVNYQTSLDQIEIQTHTSHWHPYLLVRLQRSLFNTHSLTIGFVIPPPDLEVLIARTSLVISTFLNHPLPNLQRLCISSAAVEGASLLNDGTDHWLTRPGLWGFEAFMWRLNPTRVCISQPNPYISSSSSSITSTTNEIAQAQSQETHSQLVDPSSNPTATSNVNDPIVNLNGQGQASHLTDQPSTSVIGSDEDAPPQLQVSTSLHVNEIGHNEEQTIVEVGQNNIHNPNQPIIPTDLSSQSNQRMTLLLSPLCPKNNRIDHLNIRAWTLDWGILSLIARNISRAKVVRLELMMSESKMIEKDLSMSLVVLMRGISKSEDDAGILEVCDSSFFSTSRECSCLSISSLREKSTEQGSVDLLRRDMEGCFQKEEREKSERRLRRLQYMSIRFAISLFGDEMIENIHGRKRLKGIRFV
ncbi:hypothetical protein M231_04130 [Tremella mesenterica]|uniref:Uncharacterized protein n=1 Tax=Tremella mesenterica TaxID=5217 RepID=A0A4Q1BLH7_TREME|nr:hypothetical protein M231_04130 [Tremella mesenterica]